VGAVHNIRHSFTLPSSIEHADDRHFAGMACRQIRRRVRLNTASPMTDVTDMQRGRRVPKTVSALAA
jgi:hypothetical protein